MSALPSSRPGEGSAIVSRVLATCGNAATLTDNCPLHPESSTFFEYHCHQDHNSGDAELWYRSHQAAYIVAVAEPGYGETAALRAEYGEPRIFQVRFSDGYVGDAFEDELLASAEFADPAFGPPSAAEIAAAQTVSRS